MKYLLLSGLATLLFTIPAHALFEIRAGYGINTPADKDYTAQTGTTTLETMSGFNGDVIVELPMMPLGLGLRYEKMQFDISNVTGFGTLESDVTRTSLLVNYRFIDLFAYVGAIGTFGFANDVAVSLPGSADLEYDSDLTFSVGAEAGVSLGLIMLGGELGYFSGKYENTNGTNNDLDLSGVYAKAIVGVGF